MIVQSGAQRRYSFWADTPAGEFQLYQQFLDVVMLYGFQLYAYGSYDGVHTTDVQALAASPTNLLTRLVNIFPLSMRVYFPRTPTVSKRSGTISAAGRLRKRQGHRASCGGDNGRQPSATFKQQLDLQHGRLSGVAQGDGVPPCPLSPSPHGAQR